MIISRRLFIFGTAAALALPAIAKIEGLGDGSSIVKRAFQASPDGFRRIRRLFFGNGEDVRGFTNIGLYIGDRGKLLDFSIGPGGFLEWWVAPMQELIVGPKETFRLDVAPSGSDAKAEIVYEADGKVHCETFDFRTGARQSWPLELSEAAVE